MPKKPNLKKIIQAHTVLRAKDLTDLGIPRKLLAVHLREGELVRLGRGLYASPKIADESRFTWIQASALVPKGVLSLLSALRFHDLTTQLPPEVWMTLPRGAWHPTNPPLEFRFVVVSESYWNSEVETHLVSKVPIRVYSAAKTVVDCFKFRGKVGMDVASEALRDFLKKNRGGSNAIWRLAKTARVQKIIQPYLDASL